MTSSVFSQNRKHLLVICAPERRLQIVLGSVDEEGDVAFEAANDWTMPKGAMAFLIPLVDQILSLRGLCMDDLGGIAVVQGPGSFTGVRIVAATVQGLMAGAEVPLAGMQYLPLIAASVPQLSLFGMEQQAKLAVLTYARRKQVYMQTFDSQGRPVDETDVYMVDAAREQLAQLAELGPVVCVGTGVRSNPELQQLEGVLFLPEHMDMPSPEVLLQQAVQQPFSLEPVQPIYLRASDAEENLEYIASKRGLSLDEAQSALNLPPEELIR